MAARTLLIIVGSTRPLPVGGRVAEWVRERAEERGFEVEVANVCDCDDAGCSAWSAEVASADAFVFVHPEHTYEVNAPTRHAIGLLDGELDGKPAALVSYGGVAAGRRAAEHLVHSFAALDLDPVATVPIPFRADRIDDDGFRPAAATAEAAEEMLAELERLEPAGAARDERALAPV
jgi:NAD(P)H-dependent FMN reductase